MVLAKILAQVVLPTPLGPQNKKAWAKWLFKMAFFKVVVICDCPTTVLKFWGLYFLAETTKFSILDAQYTHSKSKVFNEELNLIP
jgi:hypothetical protein